MRPARGRAEAGYSLVELLVVLALFALLASVAPAAMQTALPGAAVRAAGDQLVGELRRARRASLLNGSEIALYWAEGGRDYVVVQNGDEEGRRLPAGVAASNADPSEPFAVATPEAGLSAPAPIMLERAGRSAEIRIDALTGQPRRDGP